MCKQCPQFSSEFGLKRSSLCVRVEGGGGQYVITAHILQYFLMFCFSDHFVPSLLPYEQNPMHIDSESSVCAGNDLTLHVILLVLTSAKQRCHFNFYYIFPQIQTL